MQRQWIEKEKTPILVAGDSVNYDNGIRIMTIGPLAIRIVVGVIFIANGWQKMNFLQQTQGYFMMTGLQLEMRS